MKPTFTALIVIGALAVGAAPAGAVKPGTYSGTTDSGQPISITVSGKKGKKVSRINALVPTTCVTVQGGPTRAGAEIFKPPGTFVIGKTRKVTAVQDPALHYDKVTKHYKVTLKKGKRGRFRIKLHVNFSYQTLGSDSFGNPRLVGYVCQGDDSVSVL